MNYNLKGFFSTGVSFPYEIRGKRVQGKSVLEVVRKNPVCLKIRKSKDSSIVGVKVKGERERRLFYTTRGLVWKEISESKTKLSDLQPFNNGNESVKELIVKFQGIFKDY